MARSCRTSLLLLQYLSVRHEHRPAHYEISPASGKFQELLHRPGRVALRPGLCEFRPPQSSTDPHVTCTDGPRLYRMFPYAIPPLGEFYILNHLQSWDHLHQHMPIWYPPYGSVAAPHDGGSLLGVDCRGRLRQCWGLLGAVVYPYFPYTHHDPSVGLSWLSSADHGAVCWQSHQRSGEGRTHEPDSWPTYSHGCGSCSGNGVQSLLHGPGGFCI